MDPLSIVCGTSALVAQTAKVAKVLYELHGTLKDAPLLLSSIITERSLVRTTLCALQDMQSQQSNRASLISEQIFNSFNMAVACCELILADLEKDTQICLRAGRNPGDRDAVRSCRIILSKDHLQELLTQLRGQTQAITSLLTMWRSRNEEQMRRHEEDNRAVLRGIARRVMRRYTESEHSTHESQSTTSFDRFEFDRELLSAPCYQRAMHYLRKMESRQTELGGSTPEPQIIGLGISYPPEEYDFFAISSPTDLGSTHQQTQEEFTETPVTPTINVSYPNQDPTESMFEESSTPIGAREDHTDEVQSHTPFISKRRSMPPLYSQIQAVAMSPNALLGVVARAQRHRRSRSEGNEATAASTPIKRTFPSPKPSTLSPFRDSAIFGTDFSFEIASKADFNADFDEFWVLQAYREHYRSSPIPPRRIVFLGDPCVRPLWSTIRAVPHDLGHNDDDEDRKDYSLSVAIDDVNFGLHLVDMTGDHEDFAASLLEPEAHIAVIVYTIENPDSLRDVLHKWATIVQDIYPLLPIYMLGWGPEARGDTPLIDWLHGMGQKPVTYEDGAAAFHHLQAEAFLEVRAHSEKDALDSLEALSKTSIHLHHEELRGRTPIGFEFERKRLSESSQRSFGELQPPKFTILTQGVSKLCKLDLLHELDATPKTESDEFARETVTPADDVVWQPEFQEFLSEEVRTPERDSRWFEVVNSDVGSLVDEQIASNKADNFFEHESSITSSTDNLILNQKSEAKQAKASTRAPVLLRIDTGLSEQHRPRLIEISKPRLRVDVNQPSEEQELPDWETYLQRFFLQDSESRDVSFATGARSSKIDDGTIRQIKSSAEVDDDEQHGLKVSGSISEPQDSPYLLPDLPQFEPLTPKLMDFFLGEMSESSNDHDS